MRTRSKHTFVMVGSLRPDRWERSCRRCGSLFKRQSSGVWICSKCNTRPKRFAIFIYDKDLGKHVCIRYSQDKIPLIDQATAEIVLSQIRAEVTSGTFRLANYTSSKRFFSEWIKDFLAEKEIAFEMGEIAPTTIRVMRYYTKLLIRYFGSTLIKSLSTASITKFKNSLPIQTQSQNRHLLHFLRSAVIWGRFNNHITEEIKFPKIKTARPKIRAISYDLQMKVLDSVEPRHQAIIGFLLLQGCRVGEARALRVSDIDWRERKVYYRQALSGNVIRDQLKNGETSVSQCLRPETMEILNTVRSGRIGDGLLFPSIGGKPYGQSSLARIWRRACFKAGIAAISLKHASRSSIGTQLAQAGAGEWEIMRFLHHKSRESARAYVDVEAMDTRTSVLRLSEKKQ